MRTEAEAYDDDEGNEDDKMITIVGERNTRMASILALRAALSIEIKTGLKHSRGRSARAMAQDFLKLSGRPNARTVYWKLNEYIVAQLGADFNKPL